MSAQPKMESTARIPPEINTKLRALAHDLSNSIETIMQASYLLSQTKLDENTKRWSDLIDQASREAARINREIREILRASAYVVFFDFIPMLQSGGGSPTLIHATSGRRP